MTNLITAQRNSGLKQILSDVEPVNIWFDSETDEFTTKFGPVRGTHTYNHIRSATVGRAATLLSHPLDASCSALIGWLK